MTALRGLDLLDEAMSVKLIIAINELEELSHGRQHAFANMISARHMLDS